MNVPTRIALGTLVALSVVCLAMAALIVLGGLN